MVRPRGWARGVFVGVLLTVASCATPIGPAGAARATDTATGALLGLWPGVSTFSSSKTTPADFAYLSDMDSWQGTPNTVVNFYYGPSAEMFVSPVPTIWDTYHAVPMLSLATGREPFSSIVAGKYDPTLLKFATALNKWVTSGGTVAPANGKRMYIRLDWEANDNGTAWGAKETTCAALQTAENEYRAAWQHIRNYVMQQSGLTSTNVQWVYSVDQADVASKTIRACTQMVPVGPTTAHIFDKAAAMYPGWVETPSKQWVNTDVDWLGIDGYSNCALLSPSIVFSNMTSELYTVATSAKPLSFDEVGVSTEYPGCKTTAAAKAAWISQYFTYVENANVKMSLWFNDDISAGTSPEDWAVFTPINSKTKATPGDSEYPPASPREYAYSEYAAATPSSYFLDPEAGDPQIVSNSEFSGDFTP